MPVVLHHIQAVSGNLSGHVLGLDKHQWTSTVLQKVVNSVHALWKLCPQIHRGGQEKVLKSFQYYPMSSQTRPPACG